MFSGTQISTSTALAKELDIWFMKNYDERYTGHIYAPNGPLIMSELNSDMHIELQATMDEMVGKLGGPGGATIETTSPGWVETRSPVGGGSNEN